MVYNFFGLGTGLAILVLVIFGLLKWIGVPAGNFADWVFGIGIFWWLLAITVVPWNIHFDAKEVLAEAAQARDKDLPVDQNQLNYARGIAQRAFWIAIALHIISAVALYLLAATGVTSLGYLSAGAALLLTALRPAVRTYKYLAARLAMIRQGFKYPEENVLELRNRVNELERVAKILQEKLDLEDPRSWAVEQQRQDEALRQDLSRLSINLEEWRTYNQAEHQRLSREAQQAIAQLSTDGQFLDHVREIIRFFKSA